MQKLGMVAAACWVIFASHASAQSTADGGVADVQVCGKDPGAVFDCLFAPVSALAAETARKPELAPTYAETATKALVGLRAIPEIPKLLVQRGMLLEVWARGVADMESDVTAEQVCAPEFKAVAKTDIESRLVESRCAFLRLIEAFGAGDTEAAEKYARTVIKTLAVPDLQGDKLKVQPARVKTEVLWLFSRAFTIVGMIISNRADPFLTDKDTLENLAVLDGALKFTTLPDFDVDLEGLVFSLNVAGTLMASLEPQRAHPDLVLPFISGAYDTSVKFLGKDTEVTAEVGIYLVEEISNHLTTGSPLSNDEAAELVRKMEQVAQDSSTQISIATHSLPDVRFSSLLTALQQAGSVNKSIELSAKRITQLKIQIGEDQIDTINAQIQFAELVSNLPGHKDEAEKVLNDVSARLSNLPDETPFLADTLEELARTQTAGIAELKGCALNMRLTAGKQLLDRAMDIIKRYPSESFTSEESIQNSLNFLAVFLPTAAEAASQDASAEVAEDCAAPEIATSDPDSDVLTEADKALVGENNVERLEEIESRLYTYGLPLRSTDKAKWAEFEKRIIGLFEKADGLDWHSDDVKTARWLSMLKDAARLKEYRGHTNDALAMIDEALADLTEHPVGAGLLARTYAIYPDVLGYELDERSKIYDPVAALLETVTDLGDGARAVRLFNLLSSTEADENARAIFLTKLYQGGGWAAAKDIVPPLTAEEERYAVGKTAAKDAEDMPLAALKDWVKAGGPNELNERGEVAIGKFIDAGQFDQVGDLGGLSADLANHAAFQLAQRGQVDHVKALIPLAKMDDRRLVLLYTSLVSSLDASRSADRRQLLATAIALLDKVPDDTRARVAIAVVGAAADAGISDLDQAVYDRLARLPESEDTDTRDYLSSEMVLSFFRIGQEAIARDLLNKIASKYTRRAVRLIAARQLFQAEQIEAAKSLVDEAEREYLAQSNFAIDTSAAEDVYGAVADIHGLSTALDRLTAVTRQAGDEDLQRQLKQVFEESCGHLAQLQAEKRDYRLAKEVLISDCGFQGPVLQVQLLSILSALEPDERKAAAVLVDAMAGTLPSDSVADTMAVAQMFASVGRAKEAVDILAVLDDPGDRADGLAAVARALEEAAPPQDQNMSRAALLQEAFRLADSLQSTRDGIASMLKVAKAAQNVGERDLALKAAQATEHLLFTESPTRAAVLRSLAALEQLVSQDVAEDQKQMVAEAIQTFGEEVAKREETGLLERCIVLIHKLDADSGQFSAEAEALARLKSNDFSYDLRQLLDQWKDWAITAPNIVIAGLQDLSSFNIPDEQLDMGLEAYALGFDLSRAQAAARFRSHFLDYASRAEAIPTVDPYITYNYLQLLTRAIRAHPENGQILAARALQVLAASQSSAVSNAIIRQRARSTLGANAPAAQTADLDAAKQGLVIERLIRQIALAEPADTTDVALSFDHEAVQRQSADAIIAAAEKAAGIEAAVSALGENEAIVAFHFSGSDVYAVAISKTKGIVLALSDDHHLDTTRTKVLISRLDDSVQRGLYLQPEGSAIENADATFDFDAAYNLYRLLLKPLESVIGGKTQIFMTSSGDILTLPAQLLVTAPVTGSSMAPETFKRAPWLLRNTAIAWLPALSNLGIGGREPSYRKPFLGIGDPVLKPAPAVDCDQLLAATRPPQAIAANRGDAQVPRDMLISLPETRCEIEELGRQLNDSQHLYFADEATEARLGALAKSGELPGFRIISFATHAILSDAGEPALVLTPATSPTDGSDGLLLASEVGLLPIAAELVILSACNTASGGDPSSEPLAGLARAFFFAGAKRVLVSDWDVDTVAGAQIMARLMNSGALLETTPQIAEAGRKAAMAQLDAAQSLRASHPALWAPFVVVGSQQ